MDAKVVQVSPEHPSFPSLSCSSSLFQGVNLLSREGNSQEGRAQGRLRELRFMILWTFFISTSMVWAMIDYFMKLYFVLLMKSHLQSYPSPLQINSFWNLGFLLGITIILQIITGIFLGLHYTSDLHSAYSSVFFFIREI